MIEEQRSSLVTADLVQRLQDAAVSAARDVISGRRIIDLEGAYGRGLTTVEVGNDDICREKAGAVVQGRPLTLVRCPGGQQAQCFYQRNAESGILGRSVAFLYAPANR